MLMSKNDQNQISTIVDDDLFEILRIPNARSEAARVDLASAITREIRRRGMTRRDAAERLGISEADVSAVMNARIDGFSRTRLQKLLNAL
jgi:predicted XRE-type DNA-binding protein